MGGGGGGGERDRERGERDRDREGDGERDDIAAGARRNGPPMPMAICGGIMSIMG